MAKKLKTKALTTKEQRLMRYNDIITKYKKYFKAGHSLTRKQFVQLFGISNIKHTGTYEEVHRSNLRLVSAQVEINMLMRENGLYLASSDYYQNFSVGTKERTKREVVRYSSEIDINNNCTTRLEDKLTSRVKAGTWGTYNKVPSGTIKRLSSYSETPRHTRTRVRVKQI
jgi:hypothetical protein